MRSVLPLLTAMIAALIVIVPAPSPVPTILPSVSRTFPEVVFVQVCEAMWYPPHMHLSTLLRRELVRADQFWGKVERRAPNECWPWTAGRTVDGYGRLKWRERKLLSHRVAFALTHNWHPEYLPPEQLILHSCDNPRCCNPAHLSSGTHSDNRSHCAARQRTNCTKLTPDQILEIRAQLASGKGVRAIARAFGVTHENIRAIRSRQTWDWLS